MEYPKLTINLKKLRHNADTLIRICGEHGIKPGFVTKVFVSDPRIMNALESCDAAFFADSRLLNLRKMTTAKPKMLLRLPCVSEADDVIMLSDMSLNSESVTLDALERAADKVGKRHKIILMVDVGDLREGVYYTEKEQLLALARQVISSKWLDLYGIGVNLTCYGSVIPDERVIGRLIEMKELVEAHTGVKLEIVSGGNSSSIPMVMEGRMPKCINNLRLGEVLSLGKEAAYGNRVEGLYNDVFTLTAEVIEVKLKPSMPDGELGRNAFGEVIHYVDKGMMKRAICAVGMQDTSVDGLNCEEHDVKVIGASSDHLILDVTKAPAIKVGDLISFGMNYAALLYAFTSAYVVREYIDE